jgi:hypothetical protein
MVDDVKSEILNAKIFAFIEDKAKVEMVKK